MPNTEQIVVGRPWWKKRWVLITMAAVIVLVFVLVVPKAIKPKDLRGVLAEQLGVEKRNLFVNIPPRPSRYPGSILLELMELPLSLVESDDPGLLRGGPFEFRVAYAGRAAASGSVATVLFEELARNSHQVETALTISQGQVVEMDQLVQRLGGQPEIVRAVVDAKIPAIVIVRAWEGKISVSLTRKKGVSTKLFGDFVGKLKKLTEPETGSTVQFDKTEQDKAVISVAERVIVAYEAANANIFLEDLPRFDQARVIPRSSESDPELAVETLIRIDPSKIPDLEQALLEVGPEAQTIVMERLLDGDPESRARAVVLLESLPLEAKPNIASARATLQHSDPTVRRAGLRYVNRSQLDSAEAVDLLSEALKDDSLAVRREALVGLLQRGHAAASAQLDIKRLVDDPDPQIHRMATDLSRVVQH